MNLIALYAPHRAIHATTLQQERTHVSRWREFAGKGAARRLRKAKRREADDRDEVTPWERTAAHRRAAATKADA